MQIALSEMVVEGILTNIPLHRELMVDARFIEGGTNIHYLEQKLAHKPDLPKDGAIRYSEHFDIEGPRLLRHACDLNLEGMCKGAVQHGLLEWVENEACFCMAAPGDPRPTDFTCPAGSGRTLSQWRRISQKVRK